MIAKNQMIMNAVSAAVCKLIPEAGSACWFSMCI